MKMFIKKTGIVLVAILLLSFFVNSPFYEKDNEYTQIKIVYVYSMDYKQESLGDLSLRDVFIQGEQVPEDVSQSTIDFWYGVYLNLGGLPLNP